VPNVGQRLLAHWAKQRLSVHPGATEEAIRLFEMEEGVLLPNDLRVCFQTVNGMPEGEFDTDLFSFWSLERLERWQLDDRSFFTFVDVSIRACGFAIALSADTTLRSVVVSAWDDPQLVASSFSDFVGRYLADPLSLL
jgi:hypothetical protein